MSLCSSIPWALSPDKELQVPPSMAIKEPMDGAGKGIADGNQEAKESQRMKQPGEGR